MIGAQVGKEKNGRQRLQTLNLRETTIIRLAKGYICGVMFQQLMFSIWYKTKAMTSLEMSRYFSLVS